MRVQQSLWTPVGGWRDLPTPSPSQRPPDLVLLFGSRAALGARDGLAALTRAYPGDRLFGCSTAGEIESVHVHDDTLVATALWFDHASVETAQVRFTGTPDACALGQALTAQLTHEGLSHVLVLSDGIHINGADLARGLTQSLPAAVTISGGLSGDGNAFASTLVCHAGELSSSSVSIIGFYGLKVGIGSLGGWDSFGPTRKITRSRGNVLLSLDGEPALALYKRYLGTHAADLPSSGLRFPLLLQTPYDSEPVVRTLLGISEAEGAMTFAGSMPEGSTAQLMRANFDRLVTGAQGAALATQGGAPPQLALLISCVGRKLVLQQRIEEEVEAVRDVLGADVPLAGFYSYGELAPFKIGQPCRLHNQTMTITTFSEVG